ncbi:hypothetical protein QFC21_001097 [Naganishia friedmannii]|uniref:Uncharacterized protein n=1 Tax=Naganishia friedmannii TaxID=89922 RepID=A0ACC2W971_9TREE|nr:hypothetical protein QFC21_001097 [Naganishia friedmannii]
MSYISDADVLTHWAVVASSPRYYAKRRRLRAPVSAPALTSGVPAKQKSRKDMHFHGQTKAGSHIQSEERGLSLEDEILDQLDEQARRRTAAAQLPERRHSTSPSLGGDTPRATYQAHPSSILPPPPLEHPMFTPGRPLHPPSPAVPHLDAEENDDVPRPSWSFATPAPPPPLRRHNHRSSPAQDEADDDIEPDASDADMSEVDELASSAVSREPLAGEGDEEEQDGELEEDEQEGEGAETDWDKTPTKAQTDEAPKLLSLPQRLWSTLRPGISMYALFLLCLCIAVRRGLMSTTLQYIKR